MKKHICAKAEAIGGHPIKRLVPSAEVIALHIPEGKQFPIFCGCHGHCAECKEAVVHVPHGALPPPQRGLRRRSRRAGAPAGSG